jgi:hypothetical protein
MAEPRRDATQLATRLEHSGWSVCVRKAAEFLDELLKLDVLCERSADVAEVARLLVVARIDFRTLASSATHE